MPEKDRNKPANTVPVLLKALRVIRTVAESSTEISTKGLSISLNISLPTCYRILCSFVAEGWLCKNARGSFSLSYGLTPLLRPLLRHELLISTAADPLARLTRETGLTTKLTVRQGGEAITILSSPSPKSTAITSRVGSAITLAIGSSGSVFLSALSDEEIREILLAAPSVAWRYQTRNDVRCRVRECRSKGICFDSGSYQPSVCTVSAPVFTSNSKIAAAITILGLNQDFSGTHRKLLARELKYAAGGCGQLLEGTGFDAQPVS